MTIITYERALDELGDPVHLSPAVFHSGATGNNPAAVTEKPPAFCLGSKQNLDVKAQSHYGFVCE